MEEIFDKGRGIQFVKVSTVLTVVHVSSDCGGFSLFHV